jgi:hypothetical protein
MPVTAKMAIEFAGAPNSGNANSGAGMGIGMGGMRSQLRANYTTEANNTGFRRTSVAFTPVCSCETRRLSARCRRPARLFRDLLIVHGCCRSVDSLGGMFVPKNLLANQRRMRGAVA